MFAPSQTSMLALGGPTAATGSLFFSAPGFSLDHRDGTSKYREPMQYMLANYDTNRCTFCSSGLVNNHPISPQLSYRVPSTTPAVAHQVEQTPGLCHQLKSVLLV